MMLNLNLAIKGIELGTHQAPWDLNVLLFKGAANINRSLVMEALEHGRCGELQENRLSLVMKFHEVLTSSLVRGSSQRTVITSLETIWSFYGWVDKNNMSINEDSVIDTFKLWTEFLINRVRVKKNISQMTAYKKASKTAYLIAKTLDLPGEKPGHNLMLLTRLERPNKSQNILSTDADKQNLSDTFYFGRLLTCICNGLGAQTIRGALPVKIELENEKIITLASGLKNPDLDISTIKELNARKKAEAARRPLPNNESLLDSYKRTSLINLRIESELLIFIAQTGMNLSQAIGMKVDGFRWQTDGEDYEVFRVYKDRRKGEVIFRCYKLYRNHLKKYLDWLVETDLSQNDDRLFPLQSRAMIKGKNTKVAFDTYKLLVKKHKFPFISPYKLRNTRVNWLLRHTDDINLTAEQMGHTPSVLMQNYARPHHQRAVNEIVKFHNMTEPSFASPGPGLCIDKNKPKSSKYLVDNTPKPDCISPEGCLFCDKHRDVMSMDYCWKLTSHLKIKSLEVGSYKPSEHNYIHPANLVIDRISLKLNAIAESSEIRRMWVQDANDLVRSGKYHPYWSGYIQLLEMNI